MSIKNAIIMQVMISALAKQSVGEPEALQYGVTPALDDPKFIRGLNHKKSKGDKARSRKEHRER